MSDDALAAFLRAKLDENLQAALAIGDRNEHLDGVPWWKAPPPPARHDHWAQTAGMISELERVERCPCGAIRSNISPRWTLLDPPRVSTTTRAATSPRFFRRLAALLSGGPAR